MDGSNLRVSGLPGVGDVGWGSHLCQLYRTREDLLETVVPFFRAGLAGHERCLWITDDPFPAGDATDALRSAIPDLDARARAGQIEVLDARSLGTPSWSGREEAARRDGFHGLRVSGYGVLERGAFSARNIIALSSYALERCGADELIEILRHHGFALVRRAGVWEAVNSATVLIAAVEEGTSGARLSALTAAHGPLSGHRVRFFADAYPAPEIAEFLRASLSSGGAAMAFATPAHLDAITGELAQLGVDVAHAQRAQQLALGDALELAGAIVVDRRAREDRFEELVEAPVAHALARHGRASIYGEIVDVLCGQHDPESALALEALWNRFLEKRPIQLLCGYSLPHFADARSVDAFRHVCDAHTDVDHEPATSDRRRLAAELEQSLTALRAESMQRVHLEAQHAQLIDAERAARFNASLASEHLAQLQIVTSALSEAQSSKTIAELVSTQLGRVFGVTRASLLLEDPPAESGGVALFVAGRRIGTLLLELPRGRELAPRERALLDDFCRQIGLALDRALAFEEVQRARERAERANGAKDEFLAMLGHELRNPLSPILTAVELMRLRGGDETLKHERAIIERQVSHMVRLVDDLLDVSRITRGKIQLKRAPVELAAIVAQAIEIASPELEHRAHRLVTSVPASGMMVDADVNRMAQVVANLLTNAAKYTPPPSGVIEVFATARGSRITLTVRDNGVGIDRDLLPHIFELFVQGQQSSDRALGGLGLGLAIARNITEMHEGTLRVFSAGKGRGSEFTVELPRVAAAAASSRRSAHAASVPVPLGCHILVVDDNADAAEVLAEALKLMGHTVEVAHDGPSALPLAGALRPQVALLDIGLPAMDGYELGERLRAQLGAIKLVALTGYGQEVDRDRSRAAGFDEHLIKPVDFERVLAVIRGLTARAS